MATNTYFDYIELGFDKLKNQIDTWLGTVYSKAGILLNSASPFGQIITVIEELFRHNIIYLKNSVNQINIIDTIDPKMIAFIARIAGHNPARAISASGVLKFQLKGGVNLLDTFGTNNPVVVINNGNKIRNNTNNLNYIFDLGGNANNVYNIQPNSAFYAQIRQGEYKTSQYTGDGTAMQTYSVLLPNSAAIDNFQFKVFYNGTLLNIRDHMYDMLKGESACWTRTGFLGGLDIYFGTNDYGFIPIIGSVITVQYLMTNGTDGNIYNSVLNDWKFVDDIYDINGSPVDMANIFDITLATNIDFASDGETPTYTKTIIPLVSRNFVLATPDQFIYQLKKLNIFSTVNAFNIDNTNNMLLYNRLVDTDMAKLKSMIQTQSPYTDLLNQYNIMLSDYRNYQINIVKDNQIFLYLIPKIDPYINNVISYFNVPMSVFYLDDIAKAKVLNFLKIQGILFMNSEVTIIQPNISKYVSFIYVRRFDDTAEDNIRQDILTSFSQFMMNNSRHDRIIKADLITTFKGVNGVDSVDIVFVGQNNENYHALGVSGSTTANSPLSTPQVYDPNLMIGIDPVMGDIIVNQDQMPLIRGGWKNRQGVYFYDTPFDNGLNSVNIIFEGVTPRKTK